MRTGTDSTMLPRKISRRAFNTGALAAGALAAAGTGGRVALAGAGGGTSVWVTADALNVRDRPGLAGNIVGVEVSGAHGVTTTNVQNADGYTWYEVNYDDETSGWSVGNYLDGVDGSNGGATGVSFPVGTEVKVATDALNVRDRVGLNSSVLAVESYGAVGTVTADAQTADGYIWQEVRFPDMAGWVATDFLAESAGAGDGVVRVGDTIEVVDGPLNIRSGPGTDYAVIDAAATGAVAQVVDGPVPGAYTWIKIDGNLLEIGWVAFEFCQVI